jgi:hypothetical protein
MAIKKRISIDDIENDDEELACVLVQSLDNPDYQEHVSVFVISEEQGMYQISNSPYKSDICALGDIIYAEFDEGEDHLIYKHTIEHSGNSTVQIELIGKEVDASYYSFFYSIIDLYFFAASHSSDYFSFSINIEPNDIKKSEALFVFLDKKVAKGDLRYRYLKSPISK